MYYSCLKPLSVSIFGNNKNEIMYFFPFNVIEKVFHFVWQVGMSELIIKVV